MAHAVAMQMEEVKYSWNEYIRELFRDQKPETSNLSNNDDGATLFKNEEECAIRSMKKRKAVGK